MSMVDEYELEVGFLIFVEFYSTIWRLYDNIAYKI